MVKVPFSLSAEVRVAPVVFALADFVGVEAPQLLVTRPAPIHPCPPHAPPLALTLPPGPANLANASSNDGKSM